MALDIKNLFIRTVSGLIYAGLLVGAIILGQLAMAIVAALFAIMASIELEKQTLGNINPSSWAVTWLLDAAILVCLIFSAYQSEWSLWLLIFWSFLLFTRFVLQVILPQKNPIQSISITGFEQFYIGLPLILLVNAVGIVSNPWIIVCIIGMIWINDTGAYLVGSLMGRHKMFPKLSPKKSWEGFLGGLLFNIGAAFIFFYCFHLDSYPVISQIYGWIYLGVVVTLFATIGDLFESMLKRSLGIKDFGNIIPGHGGILDRIDSLLFVIPAVCIAIMVASPFIP